MIGYVKGFYQSSYVCVYEVTIFSNLAVYSLAKLYSEHNAIDSIFTTAAIFQFGCLELYRLYFLIKNRFQIPRVFRVKRGCAGSRSQKDLAEYKEASLLRQNSAETAGDGRDEKMSFCVHSLSTYGT